MAGEYVIVNLRLRDLLRVVNLNRGFFEEFRYFIESEEAYNSIHAFVNEPDDATGNAVLARYFGRRFEASLCDGIGRPLAHSKAKWYFASWLFRDAPAQRLGPLLRTIEGSSVADRQANLLNEIRKFTAELLPEKASWEWPAVSEVMLARLEGSRRALKGSLFETIVRKALTDLFKERDLALTVTDAEVRLNNETYDVEVVGARGRILIPVKTRETMGGGHALLFTRDIHKSITVATDGGSACIPIVIAESWGGDLDALPSKHHVLIRLNPNQIDKVDPILRDKLAALMHVFEELQ